MNLFESRSSELPEFVSHPVGKYGKDDPGGLYQILILNFFKEYVDNFVSRRIEIALTPRPGYDAIKEAGFILLSLLARSDFECIRRVMERTIESEEKRVFFRKHFLPFCQSFVFNAIKGNVDFRNADALMSFVVSEMRFIWSSGITCEMKLSMVRWKRIGSAKSRHVERPDSEKKKEKNMKNTERTALKRETMNRKYRGEKEFTNVEDFDCTKAMRDKDRLAASKLRHLYTPYTDPTVEINSGDREEKTSDTAYALSLLRNALPVVGPNVFRRNEISLFDI